MIKVDARGLPALPFGDSDELRAGQVVLAFGSPLGLESSVTMGVVSAVARQLQPDDPMIYNQTDAPINPGNSGGPLVDTEGRLVGINTRISASQGVTRESASRRRAISSATCSCRCGRAAACGAAKSACMPRRSQH